MQRFDAVFFMLARLVTVFSLAFLVPLVWTWADDDLKEIEIWLGSFLATLCCGLLLWALTRRARRELDVRDGFLLVNLVWLVLPAFAAHVPLGQRAKLLVHQGQQLLRGLRSAGNLAQQARDLFRRGGHGVGVGHGRSVERRGVAIGRGDCGGTGSGEGGSGRAVRLNLETGSRDDHDRTPFLPRVLERG